MKSKSIFLMAISLGFGLIAAIGISQVMGRSKAPTEPKIQTVPVLLASEDLDAMTPLTAEHVVVETWPVDHVPEGAASSLEDIEGMVINQRLAKDFPIHLDNLVNEKDANVLAIPPGYKVVGIKVSSDDHLEGILQPGDRVDIIGIFRRSGPNAEPIAKTFLKRIRIFSVNAKLKTDIQRAEKTRSTTVVSVLATERQANQLVLVQRVAELKLILRSKEDDVNADEEDDVLAEQGDFNGPMSISQILGGQSTFGNYSEFFTQDDEDKDDASITSYPTRDNGHEMIVYTSSGTQVFKFDSNGKPITASSNESTTQTDDDQGIDYDDQPEDVDSDFLDGDDGIELDD